MKTDHEKSQAMQDTQAALSGLAQNLPFGTDLSELMAIPLTKFGDAIRLQLDTPAEIRKWIAQVPELHFRAALRTLAKESRAWFIPQRNPEQHRDHLSIVLRRRDELESAMVAIRGIAARRRIVLGDWEQYVELDNCLTEVDERLSTLLSRPDVARLLEDRCAFGYSWADNFKGDGKVSDISVDDLVLSKALIDVVPSNEIVTNYIVSGVLHRYVESVADSNSDFAQELAQSIDIFLESSQNVGLVARRWSKRFGGRTALRYAVVPMQILAAADHDVEERVIETELGILAPTDAEAILQTSAKNIVLIVYPGEQKIRQIELGVLRSTAPDSDGNFRLRAPMVLDTIRISLLTEEGTAFSEDIVLERFLPSDENPRV